MEILQKTKMRIRFSKLLEAAIFLLLLANIEGFTGLFFEQGPSRNHEANPGPYVNADDDQPVGKSARHKGNKGIFAHAGAQNPLNAFPAVFAAITPGMTNSIPAAPANGALNPLASVDQTGVIHILDNLSLSKFETFDPVSSLNPSMLSNTGKPVSFPHQIIVKAPAQQQRLYVALAPGFEKNYLHSGSDLRNADGYSVAATVGIRKDGWGFETGLVYAKKQYVPKKSIEIYDHNSKGYIGSYASNVEADLVSVPLKGMRQIGKAGKIRAYAVAGVTVHAAMHKNYAYNEVFYPAPSQTPNPGPPPAPHLQQTGKGLLQRGNARDNVYVSADAGLRLERPIGKRMSVFVEPSFQSGVGGASGIGPVPVRINTFSVQAGVMASL
jgi:hypothetical protein